MTTIGWEKTEVMVARNRGAECLRWIARRLSYGMFPMIASRVIWQIWPNIVTCAVFWILAARWFLAPFGADPRVVAQTKSDSSPEMGVWDYGILAGIACMALGLLMNAAVTLVNGGLMPVGGISNHGNSLWVTATSAHHLRWLGDNYSGFSLGDFVMLGGTVILMACLALDRRKNPVAAETRSPSHVRGLGPLRGYVGVMAVLFSPGVWADTWVFAVLVFSLVFYLASLIHEWHLKDIWGEL
jgi:hypothetical protein